MYVCMYVCMFVAPCLYFVNTTHRAVASGGSTGSATQNSETLLRKITKKGVGYFVYAHKKRSSASTHTGDCRCLKREERLRNMHAYITNKPTYTQYITFHYVTLYYVALHYVTIHTLHYTTVSGHVSCDESQRATIA